MDFTPSTTMLTDSASGNQNSAAVMLTAFDSSQKEQERLNVVRIDVARFNSRWRRLYEKHSRYVQFSHVQTSRNVLVMRWSLLRPGHSPGEASCLAVMAMQQWTWSVSQHPFALRLMDSTAAPSGSNL